MKSNKYPKIYFGPMSKNIVDVLLSLSTKYPIGFIPSRRQVEFNGGYVNGWTSQDFFDYVKSKNDSCLVCRDHGGRLQGQHPDDGDASISQDSHIGFDIIHIDQWKQFTTIEEVALETCRVIKHCLSINSDCKFEIGTEEAIKHYTFQQLNEFLSIVKENLGQHFSSVVYAVVQFGTKIVGTKNVGLYNKDRATQMINVVKSYGLLSKEHNGDYLTLEELKERFDIGLDAINIAPEFGVLESTSLINYFVDNMEMDKLQKFYELCYHSKKWVKWLPSDHDNKSKFYEYLICRVSGHYVFNDNQVNSWKSEDLKIDINIKQKLNKEIDLVLQKTYME